MKNPIKSAIALTTMACSVQAAELQVAIHEVGSDEGMIMAQLFSGEDNYQQGQALSGTMVPAKKGVGKLLFKDLAPGEYVVRLFHDENNNQEMDMNAFGMPTEGYGFSNEAVGNMGPPQYQDMVVEIKDTDTKVKTKALMIYL